MRALLAVVLAVALVSGSGAVAGAASKPKVKCHWVKATKKRKRHKVCVKVKATKKKTKPAAAKPKPSASSPSATSPGTTSPAVPGGSAPAAPAPAVTTPTDPDSLPSPATPDPAAPVAARVQATTREWSIALSRPTLPAGAAILQLVNRGEDAHDLHLRPSSGGADLLAIASTEAGAVADAAGTLAAGSYVLYCSLPGHEAAGMKATLTVQ
jgi:plastocyanin